MSMSVLSLCMYLHNMCVPPAHKGQKRVGHPLELELLMVVSYHVVA